MKTDPDHVRDRLGIAARSIVVPLELREKVEHRSRQLRRRRRVLAAGVSVAAFLAVTGVLATWLDADQPTPVETRPADDPAESPPPSSTDRDEWVEREFRCLLERGVGVERDPTGGYLFEGTDHETATFEEHRAACDDELMREGLRPPSASGSQNVSPPPPPTAPSGSQYEDLARRRAEAERRRAREDHAERSR